MDEKTKTDVNDNDKHTNANVVFDGVYFLILLMRYKWFIIITVVVVTASSVYYTLQMENWYKATVNVVPSKAQGGLFDNMLGNVSSALKEFGMTKLSGGSGGSSYDFIVLMQSRTAKDSLIDKFNLAKDYKIPDTMRSKLYGALEEDLSINFEKEGNYTVSILSKDKYKAVEMVNYFIQVVNGIAQKIAHEDASYNKKYLEKRIVQTDSVVKLISSSLADYSKQKMIFSPEDQAQTVGKAYSELKSELMVQETKLVIAKRSYGPNDAYTKIQESLVEDIRSKVEDAKNKPGFAGNFSLENATSVAVEYLRLSAELETFIKVKSMLLPLLEESKLEETRNTNTLIVVDPPVAPDAKAKPKRSLIVMGFMIGTFILSSIFVVILDSYKKFRKSYRSLK